ncbi:MAG: hypothetical protein Tsb0018_04750 [Opitutales bacterium]
MKNEQKVILSGVHLELTDALKKIVEEKVDKLFRHEDHILRVRVELEFDQSKAPKDQFTAKGHIEIQGPDMIVSATSEDLYKSIDQLVDKLDRKLRRRSRLQRVKRKHTHRIDVPSTLPKVEVY